MAAAALLAAGAVVFFAGGSAAAKPGLMRMSAAQSDYIEHCGGCHGFDGNSAPADIPVLKGRVGYFLCSEEGRRYLIRLPNVAYSHIADPQKLADVMNFVVFALGGKSAPKNARPYSAAEVAALRKNAMTTISLIAERARVVADLPKSCGAPASLNEYYAGQPGPNQLGVPSAIPRHASPHALNLRRESRL